MGLWLICTFLIAFDRFDHQYLAAVLTVTGFGPVLGPGSLQRTTTFVRELFPIRTIQLHAFGPSGVSVFAFSVCTSSKATTAKIAGVETSCANRTWENRVSKRGLHYRHKEGHQAHRAGQHCSKIMQVEDKSKNEARRLCGPTARHLDRKVHAVQSRWETSQVLVWSELQWRIKTRWRPGWSISPRNWLRKSYPRKVRQG